MTYEVDKDFMGLSKEQRQRKSTPIRGENEKFKISIDKVILEFYEDWTWWQNNSDDSTHS